MTDELKPHPEDFCEECGLVNVIWSAPNKLWNKLARRPDGTDPMLCPTCFIKLVEKDAAAGVQNAIDAALESAQKELESCTFSFDGREVMRKIILSSIGSNPLAEAQARIAELEQQVNTLNKTACVGVESQIDDKARIAELEWALKPIIEYPGIREYIGSILADKAQAAIAAVENQK